MILKDNLYIIEGKNETDGLVTYSIKLCPECFIYKAHFPDKPITPGVCLIQMSKELLEDAAGEKLEIHSVKNVKFLSVVTPGEDTRLTVQIAKIRTKEKGELSAQLTVQNGVETKAKLSLVFERYGHS